MDNRTFRGRDSKLTMRAQDKDDYQKWCTRVITDRLAPVLVTGPSLFQPAKHGWAFLTDRNMANYKDYPDVMAGLLKLAQAGKDVLALTGDVHYPRLSEMRAGESTIREVIASPTSLVWGSEPGPAKKLDGVYTEAKLSGRKVWPEGIGIRGDNVAVLRFTRNGDRQLRLDLEFRMIQTNMTYRVGPLRLRY
jgi:hypothetical protein